MRLRTAIAILRRARTSYSNCNTSQSVILNIIGNTYHDNGIVNVGLNYNCTFNPLDKVVELYERLVQAEKEKVKYLQKLLNGK